MNPEIAQTPRSVTRAVLLLQLKLLLDTVRDLALSPLSLAAAAVDLLLSGRQSPRYFQLILRLGKRSDDWIDLWSAVRDEQSPKRQNVDALLARVEDVVTDPKSGARQARVLKRWAERQITRRRQRSEVEAPKSVAADSGKHS